MSIYTRTGDDGTTALFGGKRVLKCEELVDVYGSIDELNSWIGLISSQLSALSSQPKTEKKYLLIIDFLILVQRDLFTIGSTLAGWKENAQGPALNSRVGVMEQQIDEWEKELPKLANFILPGGSTEAARVHIARAICRRVERQAVALFSRQLSADSCQPEDRKTIIKYFNRLSDLLFTYARIINRQENLKEIIWNKSKKT